MISLRFISRLTVAAALLMAAAEGAAQTTGKIAGQVVTSGGESLPGVNVVIEGTSRGTATDVNGEYAIIGIRPGVYTVRASYIGFTTQRRTDVRVNVDLTTQVDFVLEQQTVEGEEVTITAAEMGVRRDVTSSEARISAEKIDQLPVQEVGDLLTRVAGVTSGDGGLHIRGGRSGEVAYYINGVRVTDAYDGSIAVQVENDAIQELQVISGTYNAEFGQAMSGIVNVVTKEGGSSYEGGFEAYSGSYVVPGDGGEDMLRGAHADSYTSQDRIDYLNVDPYSYLPVDVSQYYNLRGTFGGPVGTDRLTIFAMGRYFHNDGWLYGSRLFNPDGTPGDSSLVAMNPYDKLSGQFNLKFDISSSISMNLIGLGSMTEGQNYSHGWRWNPEGRPSYYDQGYNLNLKFRHLLGSKAFYTVNLSNYFSHFERHLFEDVDNPGYNDLLLTNPDFIELPDGDSLEVVKGTGRFLRYGTDLSRFRRSTNAYLANADLTLQATKHHLVKTGFEVRLDDMQLTGFSLTRDQEGNLTIPDRRSLQYQHFEDIRPLTFSAYVQDKMEYEDFVVNAGLRLDYFDSRGRVPADAQDPNIFNPVKPIHIYHDLNNDGTIDESEAQSDNMTTLEEREAYWWEDAEPKVQVSPRIGLAYPITAQGVIHFSYGHFFQIPTFQYLFNNYGYKLSTVSGTYGPFGNADLDAQKTVMYEIGLQQGIGPVIADITGFYRDVRNWVSTPPAPIETHLPGVAYVIYANRDYSNVRGVTLSLEKQFANHYSFSVNYTYQVAEGSNSGPEQEFFARRNGEPATIALAPLNWDQLHTLNGSMFVGGSGWGVSALARYGSGYPYTPAFSQAVEQGANVVGTLPTNSRRRPTTLRIDMYGYKDLPTLAGVTPRLFAQAYNVLDARNANSVYSDTGLPNVTLTPVPSADPGYYARPSYYSEPRRIQLGVELKF